MLEMQEIEEWKQYMKSEIPIILQAGADWCQPCKKLRPMLKENARNFLDEVKCVYMDVDKFPELANHLKIKHIPQTFMFHQGELVNQFGGVPKD